MTTKTTRREFFRQMATAVPKQTTTQRAPKATTATRNGALTAVQEASRFLGQATLGADYALIQQVAALGFENWIDQQFAIPQSELLQYIYDNNPDHTATSTGAVQREWFRYAYGNMLVNGVDLLRQRVALALSEIVVVSTQKSALYSNSHGVADWYDMLLGHAFGNYRDLLQDVTLSPMMGNYLSHAGNRKTDTSVNRFPDENYAREIKQLFTIGLFYLNDDGSLLLDSNGEAIPTYDNSHITEFAKIFTGLGYDHEGDPRVNWDIQFQDGWLNTHTAVRPLVMDDAEHEQGAKTLLEGYVVPAGQTGMKDVNDALDHLFNHQNIGPFVGRRLIQSLVKSNPSAAYIGRVTAVFNNNGFGVRGDMKGIIKAILLDDEARNLSYVTDPTNGKLREPFIRYTQFIRAFHFNNSINRFWDAGWHIDSELRQYAINSSSVFNFFSPDYAPAGPVSTAGLRGPEFQLLDSYTAISTINYWHAKLEQNYVIDTPIGTEQPAPDLSYEETLVGDVNDLLDYLDVVLTSGTLSTAMRTILYTAVAGLAAEPSASANDVVRLAIHLFMICPEYAIQV